MKSTASNIHIGLVGNGRLAAQMRVHLESNNLPYTSVFRGRSQPFQPAKALKRATHVWLAVSDNAIEDVYEMCLDQDSSDKIWVHFSGSHISKFIYSVHPLMTFSRSTLAQSDFDGIHMTVSPPSQVDSGSRTSLADLIPGSKNPWSHLPSNKKQYYHALCVMAGNFPTILWTEVLSQFQTLAIPDDALFSYLDRVLKNFKDQGGQALTGPLARNDINTIKENLNSLNENHFKPIYEAFVKAKGIKL